MRKDDFRPIKPHCVMCGDLIPADRPRMAITCSAECTKDRKDFRRSKQDARECRYCRRPSTPEERSRYLRWRKHEEKNPPPDSELSPAEIAEREYKKANPPQKRGPKPKGPQPFPSDVGAEDTLGGPGIGAEQIAEMDAELDADGE